MDQTQSGATLDLAGLRPAFEAWAETKFLNLDRSIAGESAYYFPATRSAWLAWQEVAPTIRAEQAERIGKLEEENAANFVKAERYRYLRDFCGAGTCLKMMQDDINFNPDAYIDAALAGQEALEEHYRVHMPELYRLIKEGK